MFDVKKTNEKINQKIQNDNQIQSNLRKIFYFSFYFDFSHVTRPHENATATTKGEDEMTATLTPTDDDEVDKFFSPSFYQYNNQNLMGNFYIIFFKNTQKLYTFVLQF